jgi:hypothetical protein
MIQYRVEAKRGDESEFKSVKTYADIEEAIEAARTWRQAARLLAKETADPRIIRIDADGSGTVIMPRLARERGDGR